MALYYKHTLIPDQADYTPHAGRVRDFIGALSELGATPMDPVLQLISDAERISWLDGKPSITPFALAEVRRATTRLMPGRQGRNPLTGEMVFVPQRYYTVLSDLGALPLQVEGLDQYEFEVSGIGPPKLSLFEFNLGRVPFESPFEFRWRCCLRREIVSTSDYHGDQPGGRESLAFDQPVDKIRHTGYFSNPETLETITVPSAGCARFRVEFALGKGLFPKIREGLDLLNPLVLAEANRIFGVSFAQGCWWG